MFGKFSHAVDPKGRLFVPSKLREELGDTFYVSIGLGRCLAVYPTQKWNAIEKHINEMPLSKAPAVRYFFANVCKCETDKQGRFLIPADLRRYAALNDDVTFVGQGDHAEIWNAETFAKDEEEFLLSSQMKSMMEDMGL